MLMIWRNLRELALTGWWLHSPPKPPPLPLSSKSPTLSSSTHNFLFQKNLRCYNLQFWTLFWVLNFLAHWKQQCRLCSKFIVYSRCSDNIFMGASEEQLKIYFVAKTNNLSNTRQCPCGVLYRESISGISRSIFTLGGIGTLQWPTLLK